MKYVHLKRLTALILSVCILLLTAVMCISAEIPSDTAFIEFSGERVTLNLEFADTYYNLQNSGYDDANDYRGRSLNLTNAALNAYNTENSAGLTLADITAVRVKTVNGAFLCGQFISFIKDKLLNVEEIDLNGASVTTRNYAWETDGYTDNAIYDGYFGVYSGEPRLTAVKKIILPDTLEIIMNYAFKNLKTLETIVFGSSLKSIGYEAFQNCPSLKTLNLPDSLNQFTSDTVWYVYGCTALGEVSYHGNAEGAADKNTFYKKLASLVTDTVKKADMSGSGITSEAALAIAEHTGIAYINLLGCTAVEYNSASGVLLYDRLMTLKDAGATVLMPETSGGSEEPTDKGELSVNGDNTELTLEFIKTYYDTQNTSFGDADDIRGRALMLTTAAVKAYNRTNGTDIDISDITALTVKTADGVYITSRFASFIKTKLPQLTEIDMSGANVTTQTYAWENAVDYTPNVFTEGYFGEYYTNKSATLYKIKKIILPNTLKATGNGIFKDLTTLETVVFGNSLQHIELEAFQGCSSLKNADLPDSLIQIGNEKADGTSEWVYYGSSVNSWSYHGWAADADDPYIFFENLIKAFNKVDYKKVDLSGSAVSPKEALLIKDSVTYLDLRNCFNLEYSSDDGKKLYDKLTALIKNGATVYMPSKSELDAKFLVNAKTNDVTMGAVRGTTVYDKADVPIKHTFTAVPNDGYELIGWLIEGESAMREPGTPDSSGRHYLTVTVNGPMTVTGYFEIKSADIPEGNIITKDANGKLHIELKNIKKDSDISVFTQILLKNLKVKDGVQYYPESIESIKISSADGAVLSNNMAGIFPEGFNKALQKNLKELDVYNVNFLYAEMPAGYVEGYTALCKAVLPKNLKSTGYISFSNCTSLKTVDLPDTVEQIGLGSFQYSGLEKIRLPEGIKTIERSAFAYAENFKGTENSKDGIFRIPDSVEKWCSTWGEISVINTANLYNDSGTQWMFIDTQVKGVEFHGAGNPASFSRMIAVLEWRTGYYDFRGSGINEKQLAVIPFTTAGGYDTTVRTTYLDIRDCPIDYTTAKGKALKKKLTRYIEENPEVTILWDDGIIRDKGYTPLNADITLNKGQTMEQALADWSAENGGAAISEITDLKIKTFGGRVLTAADCLAIRNSMLTSLRKLDVSAADFENNSIPDEAFKNAENLTEIKLPGVVKDIGKYAFFGTDINSLVLPDTVELIDDYAYAECFSLEGEIKLPNGLKSIGTGVFADSGFNKLVYHGPVDIALAKNFTYALETVEYLDLRGCTAVTEKNFPLSWSSLKVANLDYCSINGALNGDFYWSLIGLIDRYPIIITLRNQCVPYDDLDAMLAETIYGKPQDYYPADGKSRFDYDNGIFGILDVDEIEYALNYNRGPKKEDGDSIGSSSESTNTGDKKTVVKKKVVTLKRRKKPVTEETSNFPMIYIAAAAIIVAAGATVTAVLLIRRKRKKA